MIFCFELIKEFKEASAYSYFGDIDKVDLLFRGMITDEDLIRLDLEKKYPEKQGYLVIIDFIEENMGSFRIRVYKTVVKQESNPELSFI